MKKILYILCITLIASLAFSSCNSQKNYKKKKAKTAAKRYNHNSKDCGCH